MPKDIIKIYTSALKTADVTICATDEKVMLYGSTPQLFGIFAELCKAMANCKGANEKMVREAVDMAFMPADELNEALKKEIEKLKEKLEEKVGGNK